MLLAVPPQGAVDVAPAAIQAHIGLPPGVHVLGPTHPMLALGAPHTSLDLGNIAPRFALCTDVLAVQLAMPTRPRFVHGAALVAIKVPLPVVRADGKDHGAPREALASCDGLWAEHLSAGFSTPLLAVSARSTGVFAMPIGPTAAGRTLAAQGEAVECLGVRHRCPAAGALLVPRVGGLPRPGPSRRWLRHGPVGRPRVPPCCWGQPPRLPDCLCRRQRRWSLQDCPATWAVARAVVRLDDGPSLQLAQPARLECGRATNVHAAAAGLRGGAGNL
mmetsp:Transcript_106175/g.342485  ORF Transcript_106175/g.342485 Transcript_106175/m.342485 type:complete len:275 (+) Transcript_106175:1073-1897(+)